MTEDGTNALGVVCQMFCALSTNSKQLPPSAGLSGEWILLTTSIGPNRSLQIASQVAKSVEKITRK